MEKGRDGGSNEERDRERKSTPKLHPGPCKCGHAAADTHRQTDRQTDTHTHTHTHTHTVTHTQTRVTTIHFALSYDSREM